MSDLLRMDYINSLPQPFTARFFGDRDLWWPVHDFEVQTALMRIDVCGRLQVMGLGQVAEIRDGDGTLHDPDTFWSDYVAEDRARLRDDQRAGDGGEA